MAKYKRTQSPIRLGMTSIVSHNRVDLNPIFHCVSWREKREPSNSNRRFYIESGSCWSITIKKAREMMLLALDAGYFNQPTDDPGLIKSAVVVKPDMPDYEYLINTILVQDDFESEWRDSSAVICNQSCGTWRKVMLINHKNKRATFRSLTSDHTYRLCHKQPSIDGWLLDRAMLDAHPTAFIHWLNYLKSI
jgi:hypothetical protein